MKRGGWTKETKGNKKETNQLQTSSRHQYQQWKLHPSHIRQQPKKNKNERGRRNSKNTTRRREGGFTWAK